MTAESRHIEPLKLGSSWQSDSMRPSPLSVSCPTTRAEARSIPGMTSTTHAQQLAEAGEILARQGVVAEMIEPSGEPATAIERVAVMGRFDTIVVGSRGLGAVSRFLRGSVSAHVATHSDATVVIAH